MDRYVIRGGGEGRARLALLSRVLHPTTAAFLDRVGVAANWACLDLGCGGGDVTCEIARRVGPMGSVLGIDREADVLAIARAEADEAKLAQVEYRQADALAPLPEAGFDLAYARFLLTHLPDAAAALDNVARALRPGGLLAVEDIDFTGHVSHPPCPAFARYVELYREVVRRRGGDADIGPRLPSLLRGAGFREVQVHAVQPVALEGETKEVAGITLRLIAGPVQAEGLASAEEVAALLADLDAFARDPNTLLSLPRIFQVCGRK